MAWVDVGMFGIPMKFQKRRYQRLPIAPGPGVEEIERKAKAG